MPWTAENASEHKKGLTPKQAKQWARIANAVLAKCISKGGDDKTCAPSAIKQANGVVGNNSTYSTYKSPLPDGGYEVLIKVHQEKPYLIVPVTMMVEGVLDGSHGPLLHLAEDFGKIPESWNGIPIVMNHPEDDGKTISANSPEIIDSITVGRTYNTKAEGKKLIAEAWFDEEKLNEVSPETLVNINGGKVLEVSVGVFTEDEDEKGDYNGKEYEAIARNHRPDHLAVLTEFVGACSIKDGCGLGANKEIKKEEINKIINSLYLAGYSINEIGDHSEQGYNERMSMIYDKLRSLDTQSIYNYLEECYDDYLIYSVSEDNNRKMYKQSYKIESGKIEFVGESMEVHKKVEYVLNRVRNTKNKEVKMPTGNDCPKCVEKINALITNKESGFVEADREWLNTLSESALDKVTPKVIEKEKIVEKTIEVNKLAPEDQAALAFGKKQLAERRATMMKGIQDNAGKELWPDAVLTTMNDETLERVFNTVRKDEQTDYSLINGIQTNVGVNQEPLYPAGVVTETKK